MSVTVQKVQKLQGEKSKTTTFIVCDDREQTWSLIEAKSIEKAVEKAKEQGYDPCYIVEKHLATDVQGIADDGL
ncbi:hypothetical protein AKJ41_06295 [candidate division MSBL1 archaeon SCGC-AAA259O05]|uniref:Uncharacterized protein n=1 Tax=candidate division MSBL1 archaeon SCGC-AAA259O05 TaxID=1698271 RepID=A0A133UXB7_9EURY|nr:hypothetical protein AKJ41_06295 [candidate division MSBL1 archaeon SCGC-AAA259O05]